MNCATNSCSENPSELFVAHPNLHPEQWHQWKGTPESAVRLAESLRVQVPGSVDPQKEHWKNVQITLYQHALLENPTMPNFDQVLSASMMHEFSHLVVSIPFFYPVPLPCQKNDPVSSLLHLICPNRCQLRSLIDEISSSIHSHTSAKRFLECGVWSSVLGTFPGATSAPLEARRRLLRAFRSTHHADHASPEVSSPGILGHMLRHKYHQSLFFCLKEALVYMVNANSAIRDVLEEFHGWNDFCNLVRSAMETARRNLVGTPEEALERFDKTLQHVSKQKIRRLFDCPGRDWERELMQECEKHFTETSALGRSPHWKALNKAVLRHSDTFMDLSWMKGLAFRKGDSPQRCAARAQQLSVLVEDLRVAREAYYEDGSKTKLRACLKHYDWDDVLVDVADLSEAFLRKRQCHFVSLPVHTTVAQIRALRRVFRVPNGQEELPRLCGVAAVCECCRSFRSFLTPQKKRVSASNGLIAFGFHNALIDPSEPTTFFCARKNKWKATRRKGTGARTGKTGRALRQAKHYGRMCEHQKLTQINLIGRLLVYDKKIYGICSGKLWYGQTHFCFARTDPSRLRRPLFSQAVRIFSRCPANRFSATTSAAFDAWTRRRARNCTSTRTAIGALSDAAPRI